jgi:hypothetical protein
MEAFNIAYDDAYGVPPLSGAVQVNAAYAARAEKDCYSTVPAPFISEGPL